MGKLNQIIAIEKGIKARTYAFISELSKTVVQRKSVRPEPKALH